jgi:hypothetical protein
MGGKNRELDIEAAKVIEEGVARLFTDRSKYNGVRVGDKVYGHDVELFSKETGLLEHKVEVKEQQSTQYVKKCYIEHSKKKKDGRIVLTGISTTDSDIWAEVIRNPDGTTGLYWAKTSYVKEVLEDLYKRKQITDHITNDGSICYKIYYKFSF